MGLSRPLHHSEGVEFSPVEFRSHPHRSVREMVIEGDSRPVGNIHFKVERLDSPFQGKSDIELHQFAAQPCASIVRMKANIQALRFLSDVPEADESQNRVIRTGVRLGDKAVRQATD